MTWRFEKSFNLGHVFILMGGLTTGAGLYYATQAKIASVEAESRLTDAVQNVTLSEMSRNQVEITRTLDRLRDEQAQMRAEMRGVIR